MKLVKVAVLMVTFFLFLSTAFAQNTGKINGSITGKGAKATEAATVSLLRAKDSATVKISAADKDGKFFFENLADGKYIVAITAVGHRKSYSELIEINTQQQEVELPVINLEPVSKELAGVTVTAKRPLVEQRIDKTIVNVDASITNIGTSALEVLEKSPGVSVDRDGNISVHSCLPPRQMLFS